jgi:hypothetical protein
MTIDWQDVVITIGTTVGGGTVLLSASAWLIKKVLDTKLTQQTEAFKARLKADGDAEIEKLKHSLEKVAVEHQVRFSTLHTDRAKIIADLYTRLVDAERDGDRFVKVEAWDAETRREAYETTERNLVELYFFVEKNRIYLPEPVCETLKDFVLTVRGNAVRLNIYASIDPIFNTQRLIEERIRVVNQVYASFQGKIPAARKALETEFRTILGVE